MIVDSHKKTIAKTIVYRIIAVITIALLSLAFGASNSTAGGIAIFILVFGCTFYYIHDRLWTHTNWLRTDDGFDKVSRSAIKTAIYRIVTLIVAFFLAKLTFTDSNSSALAFTISQSAANMVLYYIVERVFNLLSWGKIELPDEPISE